MNRYTATGRVVRPVSTQVTPQGTTVMNNVLAVRKIRGSDEQTADFIPFVAWGKTAEMLDQYVRNGHQIAVDGRLQSRHYRNKDDQEVYVVELVVNTVDLLEPKKKETLPESGDLNELLD